MPSSSSCNTARRSAAAEPHGHQAKATGSYTPVQVAQAYAFPSGASGQGETVGILELGGGFSTADLSAYFGGLGLKNPSVTAVGERSLVHRRHPLALANSTTVAEAVVSGIIALAASSSRALAMKAP